VEYRAFDDYFRGRPKIDRLVIKFYPSVDTLMQAIEAKEVDIGWALPVANIPQIQALEPKGINLVSVATTGSDRYNMNPAEPLFEDVRVRQALHHAIDRQAIIDEQLFGFGTLTNSEWGGSPWENTNIQPYEYSVEKCKELMAEAGWTPGADGILEKDGQKFSFLHLTWSGNLQRANTQLIVQQMFKECGVDMRLETRRSAELFGTWAQGGVWSHGDYQMGGWAHSLRVPDPEVSNRFLCSQIASESNQSGSQWYRYCNPEVDELLMAQAQELDPAARTELLMEIQERLHEDAYTIYLFRSMSIYTVRSEIKNFVLHPFANFYWNPQEWEWGE
jgi:peptide/nickel transport system substrate-binding protein